MADDIAASTAALYRFPHQPIMRAKVQLSGIRKAYRKALADRFGTAGDGPATPCRITDALERAKDTFQQQDWVFLEGYFEDAFHRELVAAWPKSYYFNPVSNILKSYDIGLAWGIGRWSAEIDKNPVAKSVIQYLNSDTFADRVTEFCGDGVRRANYGGAFNRSFTGSSIIPHRDSVARTEMGHEFVNIVCFVDGSGGGRSGGLCMMDGPEFKDIVFEPQKLSNTAIIYRSSANLWHGFPPLRYGAFRWAINSQFGPADKIRELTARAEQAP